MTSRSAIENFLSSFSHSLSPVQGIIRKRKRPFRAVSSYFLLPKQLCRKRPSALRVPRPHHREGFLRHGDSLGNVLVGEGVVNEVVVMSSEEHAPLHALGDPLLMEHQAGIVRQAQIEQADINRQLSGIETLLLYAEPQYANISSSLVRELRHFGRNADEFLVKA